MDLSREVAGAEAGRSDHTGIVERTTMSKTTEYVHHPCDRLDARFHGFYVLSLRTQGKNRVLTLKDLYDEAFVDARLRF
jgi:hypothetical protein